MQIRLKAHPQFHFINGITEFVEQQKARRVEGKRVLEGPRLTFTLGESSKRSFSARITK